jgi:hypothetical protein
VRRGAVAVSQSQADLRSVEVHCRVGRAETQRLVTPHECLFEAVVLVKGPGQGIRRVDRRRRVIGVLRHGERFFKLAAVIGVEEGKLQVVGDAVAAIQAVDDVEQDVLCLGLVRPPRTRIDISECCHVLRHRKLRCSSRVQRNGFVPAPLRSADRAQPGLGMEIVRVGRQCGVVLRFCALQVAGREVESAKLGHCPRPALTR